MPKLTVVRSRFTGCTTLAQGGALLADSTVVAVTGSEFSACAAACGGALGLLGPSYLTLSDTVLHANSAAGYGGGVCLQAVAAALMTGGAFTGNTATGGGGAVFAASVTYLVLQDTTLTGSVAGDLGGGTLHVLASSDASALSSLTLQGLVVTGSRTTGSGGVLYLLPSPATALAIRDCRLEGVAQGGGGAVFVSGGAHVAGGAVAAALAALRTDNNSLAASRAEFGPVLATSGRLLVLECASNTSTSTTPSTNASASATVDGGSGQVGTPLGDSGSGSGNGTGGPQAPTPCPDALDTPALRSMVVRLVDALGQGVAGADGVDTTAICTAASNDSSVVVLGNTAATVAGVAAFPTLTLRGLIGATYTLQVQCQFPDGHMALAAQQPRFTVPPCLSGEEPSPSMLSCTPCAEGQVSPNGTACRACPAGEYSLPDGVVCVPCPLGTYNPLLGVGSVSGCRSCRLHSEHMETLTLGAASPASCVCSAGYYLHNSVCVPVMEGVNATAVGQTLPTLQLLPGYWRTGPNSPDVSPCRVKGSCLGTSPAFIAAVAAGEGPDADTPVVGGLTFSDSVCMPLATGPMCELCEKPLAVQNGVCVLCMSDDFIILTPAGNCLLAALFLFGVLQILRNRPTLFSRRFRGPKTYASSSMSAVTPNGTGPGGPETELAAGGGAKQAELAGRAGPTMTTSPTAQP
jgi:hypothetical protein